MGIAEKINNIRKLKDFNYLLDEKQDKEKIRNYYNTNKFAYLLFHNKSGYLHMGISKNGYYNKSDLLEQVKIIEKEVEDTHALKILELGYGRGANLYSLAKTFPQKKFIGIDLSTNPLKKYQINNIDFIKRDYDDLSSLENNFDIVFAIETLCHSISLGNTLKEAYSIMRPGAKLIIFDGYYLKDFDSLDKDTQDACQLTERGMAVNHFHKLKDLRVEIGRADFTIVKEVNFSDNILPSLFRFEKLAKIYFQNPILSRLTNHLLPEMFVRNALSGYLMPELIKSEIAGYYMHILQKS
jgi:SAM-dependent methyltransferase